MGDPARTGALAAERRCQQGEPVPARTVFLTAGTAGDILPFASLAQAFAATGRDVLLIAHIDSKALLSPFDVPCKFFGKAGEHKRKMADPRITHPTKGFRALFDGYGASAEQVCQVICESVVPGPVRVIAHPFSVPAATMARELGLVQSVVAGYLAPSMLRTVCGPIALGATSIPAWMPTRAKRSILNAVDRFFVDPVAATQTNWARRNLGLPPIRSFLPHVAESPDLSVTLFPYWFAAPQPDWPAPMVEGDFQFVPVAAREAALGDRELEAFFAQGEAPILFTPGSSNRQAHAFFRMASQVVRQRKQRAIFLTPYPEQLPHPLPESIQWVSFIELSALLPYVCAVVHHGGIGTVAQALRFGVPQVVTPFAWDQFDNARRVVDLAGGVAVRASDLTPARLSECLHRIETSVKIRHGSASFKGRLMRPPQVDVLCSAIDKALA